MAKKMCILVGFFALGAMENNRTLPYGEPWLQDVESVNKKKFTTYDRDAQSNLDYAINRRQQLCQYESRSKYDNLVPYLDPEQTRSSA
jgi:hypothetical protein